MEIRNRFIAPQRVGAWLVVTLGTALAALVIGVWGILESRTSATVLQVEILKFDQRIKSLEKSPSGAMPEQSK
jgi:Tfp pilus assembly protein PilN